MYAEGTPRRLRPVATLAAGCAFGLGALLGGCASAPRSPAVSPDVAYQTFDTVWGTIDEQHFDPTHNGVDWVAVREEYRPQVASVATEEELRRILEAMIARLGQSHFAIIASAGPVDDDADGAAAELEASAPASAPASDGGEGHGPNSREASPPGDIGVLFRLVDGRVMTIAPQPGTPAAHAGIEAGWILRSVNGQPPRLRLPGPGEQSSMSRYIAETSAANCVEVDAGGSVTLVLEDQTGTRREIALIADPVAGQLVKFGNLPPLPTRVEDRWIAASELRGAQAASSSLTIGYLRFNIWMVPAMPLIDAAIDRFRKADGMILDLRGNPGGVGAMAMGVGGHFLATPVNLGTMLTRDAKLEFRVNPRTVTADGTIVAPYAGPLAILVDPLTASTSEIFAAGLQEAGRARIFGQTTAGAALPANAMELPNHDVLLYALADFVTAKGNRIEGRGVLPDEPVVLTRAQLRREPDPTLAAALRWIASQKAAPPNPAGSAPTPRPAT